MSIDRVEVSTMLINLVLLVERGIVQVDHIQDERLRDTIAYFLDGGELKHPLPVSRSFRMNYFVHDRNDRRPRGSRRIVTTHTTSAELLLAHVIHEALRVERLDHKAELLERMGLKLLELAQESLRICSRADGFSQTAPAVAEPSQPSRRRRPGRPRSPARSGGRARK